MWPSEYDEDSPAGLDDLQVIVQRLAALLPPTAPASMRTARLQAALTAYENARMDGLCHEGAWELALHELT